MNRWDKARHEQRVAAISRELGRLLRAQTEFDSNRFQIRARASTVRSPRKRIRELFAELERLRSVA